MTSRRRKPLRILLWVIGLFLVATFLLNLFSSDLDLSGEDRIALVRIEGAILDSQETVGDLKEFGQSPFVKAIVLRIDSPGGAVVPSQEIYDAVRRVKTKHHKKVITSMGTVAASGGYYIAAASDHILANPGTLTGSIGVIMELANLEGLLSKVGVESIVIKSGRHKDLASPFRKMNQEDRTILQAVMDDVHQQFIQAVAEGRSLSVQEAQALADGRIFTGRQAKDLQLVDELGNLDDAIQLAASMVGIEGEPKIVEPKRQFSLRTFLESKIYTVWPPVVGESGINLKYMMAF